MTVPPVLMPSAKLFVSPGIGPQRRKAGPLVPAEGAARKRRGRGAGTGDDRSIPIGGVSETLRVAGQHAEPGHDAGGPAECLLTAADGRTIAFADDDESVAADAVGIAGIVAGQRAEPGHDAADPAICLLTAAQARARAVPDNDGTVAADAIADACIVAGQRPQTDQSRALRPAEGLAAAAEGTAEALPRPTTTDPSALTVEAWLTMSPGRAPRPVIPVACVHR